MKAKNYATLEAYGVKVQVNSGGCVYVKIGGLTVYFENSGLGPILQVSETGNPDKDIDFTGELQDACQDLGFNIKSYS